MRGVHSSSQQESDYATWWYLPVLIVSDFQESALVSKKLKFKLGFSLWCMVMIEGFSFQERQLGQNRIKSPDTDCVPVILGFYKDYAE